MFRNVFVLCTGRCGSTTFVRACGHIANYTAGHETRTSQLGESRFAYPSFHIEADNRLSWLLGRLENRYRNEPFYLHLKRDPDATARSFTSRGKFGMMSAYQGTGIIMHCKEKDQFKIARDYVDTVNANISSFLKDKENQMAFELENAEEHFRKFWVRIGAEGDIQAALSEFRVRYNASA